ncbi:putative deoxyribonuclease TATDN1 like protein [Cucumispora dikerogammari]|nr:putative deoxyribonuclease TATDN1 like protein [Cucumispora dikerogammari]
MDPNKQKPIRFILDIAFNITDHQIKHIPSILLNCQHNKICPIFVGSNASTSRKCIELSKKYKTMNYTGLHPSDSTSFEDLKEIKELLLNHETNRILAIGECGLDLERLNRASLETQIKAFEYQLSEFRKFNLPFFFHSRSATEKFIEIFNVYNEMNIAENIGQIRGVIHSFTDTLEDLFKFLKLGLFISLNGLSLNKDKVNGYPILLNIPLDLLLLETDSPYCILKDTEIPKIDNHVNFWNAKSNYGLIKNRLLCKNEPSRVLEVFKVVCKVRGLQEEELTEILYKNSKKLFGDTAVEKMSEFFTSDVLL